MSKLNSSGHRAGCLCDSCQMTRASFPVQAKKDYYPAPKAGRNGRAKPKALPLVEFPTREAWEEGIFRKALGFNVVRFGVPAGSESMTVGTFPEAVDLVNANPRSLMYCFNADGNAFCLVKAEFDRYTKIWQEMGKCTPAGE